jgi:hypothetical protein
MDCRASFFKIRRIIQNVRTDNAIVRDDVTRKRLTHYVCTSFLIEGDHTFYFEQCSTILQLFCACSIALPPPSTNTILSHVFGFLFYSATYPSQLHFHASYSSIRPLLTFKHKYIYLQMLFIRWNIKFSK